MPKNDSRILGPAVGRLINRNKICLECMDLYGPQKERQCEHSRPPRNPKRPRPEDDL
jgi:hypothetical protein